MIELSRPAAEAVGSITVRLRAPAPMSTEKVSALALHARFLNDEPLRPSSQVSIWRPETIGTWRDWAVAVAISWSSSKVVA